MLVFDARASEQHHCSPRFGIRFAFCRGAPGAAGAAIAAGTTNGRLDAALLDSASVLMVGGPDALTASEVDLIERFRSRAWRTAVCCRNVFLRKRGAVVRRRMDRAADVGTAINWSIASH